MTDSKIVLHKDGGTTFSGPDATRLYSANIIKQGLLLYRASKGKILLTRGATRKLLLQRASAVSKKVYPQSAQGVDQAIVDLTIWIDNMKAALPVERN